MEIVLNDIGKRYRYDWIFRELNLRFQSAKSYAVLGPNGSGKSTFLKILCGHLTPSQGKISYTLNEKPLQIDEVYRHISFAAPYIELIEEFSLEESLIFHNRFKKFQQGLRAADIIQLLGFENSRNKEVRNFSSGMKQRLKLAMAICSDTKMLLLDEPTTNLDRQGTEWYLDLIGRFTAQRLVVIASNVETDFGFCEERIDILDFKKRT